MELLHGAGDLRDGSRGKSPLMVVLLAALAYRRLKDKSPLAEILNDCMSGMTLAGVQVDQTQGAVLIAGLNALIERFRANGLGDKALSWVSTGPNRPIAPSEVEDALGKERLQWLMRQTAIPRDQLIVGLSGELPELVDKLTPEGRIPTEEEAAALIGTDWGKLRQPGSANEFAAGQRMLYTDVDASVQCALRGGPSVSGPRRAE